MWRSEFLIKALYRSATVFDENIKELINHPECKKIFDIMIEYLKEFVEIPVPDIRCTNELDILYNSLVSTRENVDCFRKLPLEWQSVLLTHFQNSCAFQKNKQVRGSPDVEYILPTTVQLFTNLTSIPYWSDMMILSMEYAYADRFLPNIDVDMRKGPSIKGSEAILYKIDYDEKESAETRERLCLMQNMKTISPNQVPNITLTEPLRVFSDQQLTDSLANFPQPELQKLIDSKTLYNVKWSCGYIWTHTYPFWNWENGRVRLDITIPENTTVMYTPFSETHMFTSIFDASRHMTLLLKPGILTVTEINKVPRPVQHGLEEEGIALHTQEFITIIKCKYTILLSPNLSPATSLQAHKKAKLSSNK